MTGTSIPRARFQLRAGLSGYVAEQVSARICYELGLPADLHESHASYVSHWLEFYAHLAITPVIARCR